MDEIRESLRTFIPLLYKTWLIRKKHWRRVLILQIAFPFLLLMLMKSVRDFNTPPQEREEYSLEMDTLEENQFHPDLNIYFSPSNDETKDVMKSVTTCLELESTSIFFSFLMEQ